MKSDGINVWPDVFAAMMTLPLAGAAVSAVAGFTITLLQPILATGLVQTSTDYEIRTGPNGTGVAVYSLPASLSLLGTVVPIGGISGLVAGQTYYIRTRVNTAGGSSVWSQDTQITT